MKWYNRIWAYVSAALFGVVVGIVVAVKWLTGEEINVSVKKLKLKDSPEGKITIDAHSVMPEKGLFDRIKEKVQTRRERRKNKNDGSINS